MKKIKGALVIMLLLVISMGLFAAGCGGQTASGEKVIKFGVQGPLTGPNSRVGSEMKAAVIYAFDEIGNKIGDYQVELVWIDCQSDPEKATRAYEEAALKDNIQAGILVWHSSVGVSIMEAAAKNKIPHFFGMAATGVINERYQSDPEKYSYYIAKGWPIPATLNVGYIDALNEAVQKGLYTPRNKKVAFACEDTDWGRAFAADMSKLFNEKGWEVLPDIQFFSPGETDLYPVITKLKAQNVSVVAASSATAPTIAAFIKQQKEVGLNSVIVADGLGWLGEWYSLVGDASDGVLDMIPQWTTEEAQEFAKNFEEKTGIKPSPNAAGLSYDYARFFIKICNDTLAKYGELNRETLYQYSMESMKAGTFSFTDGILMNEYKVTPESVPDMVVGKEYFMFPVIQYFGGQGKIIYPSDWKQGDFIAPDQIN